MICFVRSVFPTVAISFFVFLAGCTSTWPIRARTRPEGAQLLPNVEQRVAGDYRDFGLYNFHLWPTLTGRKVAGERVRVAIDSRSKVITAILLVDGKVRDRWRAHYWDKGSYLRVYPQPRLFVGKIPVAYGYESVTILIGRTQRQLIVNMGSSMAGLFIAMPWVGGAPMRELAYDELVQ